MSEENNKLQVKVDATLGKTLVEAAKEKRRQRFSENVVQIVDSLMESIEVNARRIEFHTKMTEMLKTRLDAIEAGEFKISGRGELKYNDEKLNEALPVLTSDQSIGQILQNLDRSLEKLGRPF